VGSMFQRMSVRDNETPPMPASALPSSIEPETSVLEALRMSNLVCQNAENNDSDNKSSSKKERSEVADDATPVDVVNAHEGTLASDI
jgi:hypothetical protein